MDAEQGLTQTLKGMAGAVLGSLARSALLVLGVTLAAGVVAYATWPALSPGGLSLRGVLVVVTMALSIGLGAVVALKRALLTALHRGAGQARLGGRTVDALFRVMLGTQDGAAPGAAAQLAARLPLAQAEERLRAAARSLLGAESDQGGVTRRLHALLVGRIEELCLLRFRQEGASGVDLLKVRDDLRVRADEALGDSLLAGRRKLTLAYAVALPLLAFVLPRVLLVLSVLRH